MRRHFFPPRPLGVPVCAVVVLAQTPNPQKERWNKVFAGTPAVGKPDFNRQPNAFLLKSVQRMTPGTALEIGMRQGRNTIAIAATAGTPRVDTGYRTLIPFDA